MGEPGTRPISLTGFTNLALDASNDKFSTEKSNGHIEDDE